jgi:hypothetical protein
MHMREDRRIDLAALVPAVRIKQIGGLDKAILRRRLRSPTRWARSCVGDVRFVSPELDPVTLRAL